MQHAEVWWSKMDDSDGNRPVVIIARNKTVHARDIITVALVTSRIRHFPAEVYLDQQDGMPRPCVINCDVLRTVPKHWLQKRITKISVMKEAALNRALKIALGLHDEHQTR